MEAHMSRPGPFTPLVDIGANTSAGGRNDTCDLYISDITVLHDLRALEAAIAKTVFRITRRWRAGDSAGMELTLPATHQIDDISIAALKDAISEARMLVIH